MKRKIPKILFFALVFAIVGLFVGNQLMAQDRPQTCSAAPYTLTPATDVGFPYLSENGCIDALGNPTSCYIWTYYVTGSDLSKINKVHFFIPSYPPNVIEASDIAGYADHISLRGDGGISTDFGEVNNTGIVISTTPVSGNSNQTIVQFATKSVSTFGTIMPVFSVGKSLLGCEALDADGNFWTDSQGPVGGIIGPGFDISAIVPAPVSQELNLPYGGCIKIKRNPNTGCIQSFETCDGTVIQGKKTRPSWLSENIVDMGDPNNRLCRDGIISFAGSPQYYLGYANGSYYCLGVYDPAVPSWTSPCP